MLISKALATGILSGSAAALLLTGPTLRGLKTGDNTVGPPAADWSREQRPLTRTQGSAPRQPGAAELPAYRAGRFTLVPQDNTTCAAYGESQWSGTVDVTDSRRLFFWFADSRNDPENDPVVIWINGGPGASSMMGLLIEMGPCWLDEDANTTVPNAWAWNNNASVLFIDQPAGVGFASVAEGAPLPASDLDGAQDFQVFLNTFFSDVFPDRAHLPIHFAAESYGGHFAPTYVKHILDSRQYDSKTAFRGNITSLILVDALIDFTSVAIGQYELLCSEFRRGSAAPGGNILNDTACEQIRLIVPECERLGRSCDLSYDGLECLAAFSFCQSRITAHYLELMAAGLRGDHNIHKPCKHRPVRGYPDSWGCADPGKGDFEQYLNLPHVKSALGFPASFVFDDFKADIYHAYASSGSQFKPTSRELAAVLDAHRTPGLGDVRVLVLQGNVDFACNTPGNVWLYDKLLWSGLADYRMMKWEDMPADMAATGFWKATPDGRLAFVAVDDAGHTVPGDAREGSYRILQRWIEGGWHM